MEKIRVSAEFPVSPAIIYNAWLSSKEHSLFTGGKAKISAEEGGKFSAWDGYITGKTIKLILIKKFCKRGVQVILLKPIKNRCSKLSS